jgi:hypothetical protein
MVAAKAARATSAAVEATIMTSTAGGVAMPKSVGQSRSRPEQEIRAVWATRPDLGQDEADGPDLSQADWLLGWSCRCCTTPGRCTVLLHRSGSEL